MKIAVMSLCFIFILSLFPCAEADVIHGCYRKWAKILRIVNGPEDCRKREQYISWNQQGPPGEDGEPGPPGQCDTTITDDLQSQINALQSQIDVLQAQSGIDVQIHVFAGMTVCIRILLIKDRIFHQRGQQFRLNNNSNF